MNLILSIATLTAVAIAHGQSSDKGIIPYPRVGRADRFYLDGKRDGSTSSPGLIPFPRIGRSDNNGIHEGKRQLIPFPRVGKRAFYHLPMDPYAFVDYEDGAIPMPEPGNLETLFLRNGMRGGGLYGFVDSSGSGPAANTEADENDMEKRSNTGNNNNSGGMLFGPRLGRRKKRSVETAAATAAEDSSAERSRDSLDTRTLLKILHNFNWAIVPIKERKPITPRLARSDDVDVKRRGPPYIPRLGRSKEVASPEVGLENVQVGKFSKSHSTSED